MPCNLLKGLDAILNARSAGVGMQSNSVIAPGNTTEMIWGMIQPYARHTAPHTSASRMLCACSIDQSGDVWAVSPFWRSHISGPGMHCKVYIEAAKIVRLSQESAMRMHMNLKHAG